MKDRGAPLAAWQGPEVEDGTPKRLPDGSPHDSHFKLIVDD